MMRTWGQWGTLAVAILQGWLIVRRATYPQTDQDGLPAIVGLVTLFFVTCFLLACRERSFVPERTTMALWRWCARRGREVAIWMVLYTLVAGVLVAALFSPYLFGCGCH